MSGPIELSDLAGSVGLALIVVWPLLRGRRAILAGQAASALAFVLHYLLIGAATGAAMASLSLVQAVTAWPAVRPWWCGALYGATVPALAVLAATTWAGPASAWAAAGLALATLARWLRRPCRMRAAFFLAGACWIAHDFIAGSLFGLSADALCMAALVLGHLREIRGASAPA